MKTQKFSENQLREMVDGLLKRHIKIGHDRLLLAVWFGEKDQTGEVHLLEVFANQPPSFSGYLETFEFGPRTASRHGFIWLLRYLRTWRRLYQTRIKPLGRF